MKDRWAKFMADQEWSDIKKETAAKHGKLVGEIQDRTLRLTDYSPSLSSGYGKRQGLAFICIRPFGPTTTLDSSSEGIGATTKR